MPHTFLTLVFCNQPSIAVRPCPVLFQLPDESKENYPQGPHTGQHGNGHALPYRSIFAVLTWDSVVIYDTVHSHPLAIVSGIHYCNLVDAAWSHDGRQLIVCSTDGYISRIVFEPGELGRVYYTNNVITNNDTALTNTSAAMECDDAGIASSSSSTSGNTYDSSSTTTDITTNISVKQPPQAMTIRSKHAVQRGLTPQPAAPTLPPCEPGTAVIEAPPCKRAKRVDGATENDGDNCDMMQDDVEEDPRRHDHLQSMDQLTLKEVAASAGVIPAVAVAGQTTTVMQIKKKKKRIQPTILSSN
jgi:hypothetical protein